MIESEDHLNNVRKIHSLIEECMNLNNVSEKDRVEVLIYTLLILFVAHNVSVKEVESFLGFIKQWHKDAMNDRGLC